jgi:hypothetical protein
MTPSLVERRPTTASRAGVSARTINSGNRDD